MGTARRGVRRAPCAPTAIASNVGARLECSFVTLIPSRRVSSTFYWVAVALRETIWHGLWRFSWVSGLRSRSQPVSSSVGSSPQLRGSRAPDQRSCGHRRLRGGAARSCELLALRSCGHRSLTGAPHEAGSCWHFTEPNRVANKRRGLPRGRLRRASFLLAETSVAAARSKSGSMRTWSSSARGAGPSASRRSRRRRSSSSGRMTGAYGARRSLFSPLHPVRIFIWLQPITVGIEGGLSQIFH